jgi:uncharacterized protein (TIRG00374 family)
VPYSHSLAGFFTERFLDVVIIALLALAGALAFDGYRGFVIAVTTGVLLMVPLLRCRSCHVRLRYWQRRVPLRRLRHGLWHLLNLLGKARQLLTWRALATGLIYGMIAWTVQGVAFMLLVQQVGAHLPWPIAFGIYATSLLIGAASFLPGGVGSTEVAMYLLLRASGADDTTALIVPLVSRLTTLWFAVGLGLLSTAYLSVRR